VAWTVEAGESATPEDWAKFTTQVRNAVLAGRDGKRLVADQSTATQMAEQVTAGVRELARGQIDRDRLAQMGEDVSMYFDYGFPLRTLSNENLYVTSMFWYLWTACHCPAMEPAERQILSEQVSEYATHLEQAIDRSLATPRDPAPGKWAGGLLRTHFATVGGNLFVPYFKRPLYRHEWEYAIKPIDRVAAEQQEGLANDIKNIDRTESDEIKKRARIRAMQVHRRENVAMRALDAFTDPFRPSQNPLPDKVIWADQAYLNAEGLWLYFPSGLVEQRPYPMDKEIRGMATPGKHEDLSSQAAPAGR
jgi:hypothetical protein